MTLHELQTLREQKRKELSDSFREWANDQRDKLMAKGLSRELAELAVNAGINSAIRKMNRWDE